MLKEVVVRATTGRTRDGHGTNWTSLLEWSTPERRRDEKVLSVIPNKIYLHVFQFITPSDERLPPEELKTFHKLSRVCKFFANVCLPRVFESVGISSFVSRTDTAHRYKASLASMLCTQISEKQPLALALAQTVRACHFTNPALARAVESSLTIDSFTFKKYISATIFMKNIRELLFSNYVVETEHWSMIAALPSLTDLSLHSCELEEPPSVGGEPEFELKVSRLSVLDCEWDLLPLELADLECLRILTMEFGTLDETWFCVGENWLLESAITELQFHVSDAETLHMNHSLGYTLERLPRSLEVLCFFVELSDEWENTLLVFAHMLGAASERLSSLRSLTVRMVDGTLVMDELSRSIDDCLPDVRRILDDEFGLASGHDTNLKQLDFFGTIFRSVDGVWSEGVL